MKRDIIFIFFVTVVLCSCNKKSDNVVAIVDGKQITMPQIDALAKDNIYSLLEGIYLIRQSTLDEYINQIVLNEMAKNNGLSYSEYIEKNVYANITDSLVNARIAELGGYVPDRANYMRSYDCSTEFGRAYLVESMRRQGVTDLAKKLRKNHDIQITLSSPEPIRPKVNLSDLKIEFKGNLSSSKSVILIGSYECEGCKMAVPLFDELYGLYGEDMKFGFCFYEGVPSLASLATKSASNQNAFWPMHDLLMNTDSEIDSLYIDNCARQLSLDIETFWNDMASPQLASEVQYGIQLISRNEVIGEPTFIINNRVFNAPFDIETMKNYIERFCLK